MVYSRIVKWIASLTFMEKFLWVILFVVVIVRIFSVFATPETAYADATYHLSVVKDILSNQDWISGAPPFSYHLILASFFFVTGFPLFWPFIKIIPLIMTLVFAVLSIVLFKRLFPKNYLLPTILTVSFPFLARIGSSNYIELFASNLVLALLLMFLVFAAPAAKKTAQKFAVLAVLFFLLCFSKINAIILSPVIALCFFVLAWRRNEKRTALLILIIFVAAILSYVLFFAFFVGSVAGDQDAGKAVKMAGADRIIPIFYPQNLFLGYLDFFDVHEKQISFIPAEFQTAGLILIFIFFLPIFIFLALGFFSLIPKNKPSFLAFIGGFEMPAFLIFATALFIGFFVNQYGYFNTRYFIMGAPLVGYLFVKGKDFLVRKLGRVFEKKINTFAVIVVIIFAFYSIATITFSAVYYSSAEKKSFPVYEYLSSLENSKIATLSKGKEIVFYTGLDPRKNLAGPARGFNIDETSPDTILNYLREGNFTHLADIYYPVAEEWNEAYLGVLVDRGNLEKVFDGGGGKVYQVILK